MCRRFSRSYIIDIYNNGDYRPCNISCFDISFNPFCKEIAAVDTAGSARIQICTLPDWFLSDERYMSD